ncbi:MAG: phage head morphogenesis protein, partial [Ruminiclostridium sp.]|nr:phage head morphogenesis protein [Ruminiclostridium sp.]
MKNSEYWKLCFAQLEEAQNKLAETSLKEIERQYRQAVREIEGKIDTWYRQLGAKGISMAEARKPLSVSELANFKLDVHDYIRYGKGNGLSGQWIKQLENVSAKLSISKYDALMIDTRQSFEQMFGSQLRTVTETMGRIYENGYYRTAYELQKGVGIGFDVRKINREEVEKVLSKPWAADGKNFSERIWGSKEKLINEVHNELTQKIITGADPQKAIDAIAKKMNTSKSNAGRLVMTEGAYFGSDAQEKSYKDLGVKQYEVLATIDSHTSEM